MHKHHIINLSNAIERLERLTQHKNTDNTDGIWFDRYIAF